MKEPELFIEKITINEVRHLKDVEIPISSDERKHLILTGKNGSGKTSVLNEIKVHINGLISNQYQTLLNNQSNFSKAIVLKKNQIEKTKSPSNKVSFQRELDNFNLSLTSTEKKLETLRKVILKISESFFPSYKEGSFILSFFKARRNIILDLPQGIKKIKFKETYNFDEKVASNFLQHIVNLKADRSFARDDNDVQVIKEVDAWFNEFEKALKFLFDDKKLKLLFDRKDYNFNIVLENGQSMPFNALSDGYSAILDVVMELMLRMEGKVKNVYDIQGIVLIDEIETHLHIDLQKKILPFLTSFFPKIQFIVSTHSPFVINSLSNTVVYDLENHTRFEDLSDYPIDGIVEGYFDNDKYSDVAKHKISEYESLTEKDTLTEKEEKRRFELFKELSDVSGKLAPELKMKFQQIQLKRLEKANG